MDEDRIKHSLSVALKMIEIGKKKKLSEEQLEELYVLGLNHDIGYQFGNNENHNEIGAEILKNSGYKYWKEVLNHGKIDNAYNSLYLDILNEADMKIDKFGNDVGYDNRLNDIKYRYGEKSTVFKNARILINKLKYMED